MSVKGHKVVGSRGFEYDGSYMEFLELFFSVAFQRSLPSGGHAKPSALVVSNKKSLELSFLNKLKIVFQAEEENLEGTLNAYQKDQGEYHDDVTNWSHCYISRYD